MAICFVFVYRIIKIKPDGIMKKTAINFIFFGIKIKKNAF